MTDTPDRIAETEAMRVLFLHAQLLAFTDGGGIATGA